jgi:hypothetical protein
VRTPWSVRGAGGSQATIRLVAVVEPHRKPLGAPLGTAPQTEIDSITLFMFFLHLNIFFL